MANIDTYLEQIAHGEYGRDVRDAIHDALEAINDSIPNSTSVSQEVISARTPGNQGLPPYDNLKQRLDTEADALLDQAEQLATPGIRANIQITNATVGYSSLKDRLDTEYADLNRKVGRVIGRADAAATAAEEAVEVATQAKDTAVSKATEAANAASTAASKATEASSAATTAAANAQSANVSASNASTSASDAAYSANEAVTAAQQAQQAAQSIGTPDTTLTQQGKAADAKKVGDEIAVLKGDLTRMQEEIDEFSGGLTPAIKEALLNCFAHVGWDHGTDKTYYDALKEVLNTDEIKSISALFTPGAHEVYTTDNIESLRNFLVVTATYNDYTQAVVTGYALEGDISSTGTKTITVKYGTKTTTFTVNVMTNATGILYEWDFTKGLTDLRQNQTATLGFGGSSSVVPTIDAQGLHFTGESQYCDLFDASWNTNTNLFGKTLQLDVASYVPSVTNSHVRLVTFRDPEYIYVDPTNEEIFYATGIMFRNGYGWTLYNGASWASNIYSGMSNRDAVSGKKLSLFFSTSGSVKLYLDGTSKGTASVTLSHAMSNLRIGNGVSAAGGATFYNALVTGARIYNGEVAN